MRSIALVGVFAVLAGCSGSGKTQAVGVAQSLSSALTEHVKFDRGLLKKGALPKANAAGERVTLQHDDVALLMKPGKSSILGFDADNPDEAHKPMAATLLQFDGSDSHIEVPIKGNTSHPDGGADQNGIAHIDNPFTVEQVICKLLCNQRFSSRVLIAVRLEDGGVCQHEERALELDCTKDGDPGKCTGGAGKPPVDAGTRDAATSGSGGTKGGGSGGTGGATSGNGGAMSSMDGGAAAGTGGAGGSGGAGGAGGTVGSGGAGGTGGTGGMGGTTGTVDEDAGSVLVPAPQVGLLTPANAAAGTAVSLTIDGSGFVAGAVAFVDGQAVPTTFVSATSVTAMIPASATANSGNLAIYVDNVSGDAQTRSNVLYLRIDAATGAPVVYDYSPDNGVAGDKILIIASNLSGQTLTITDAHGTTLTPGTLGTISWPNASSPETVEVTLPSNIATGPITVGNTLGSFKGKIFTVGSNLTRAAGTVLTSSTEYNTSNWARVSGGDNLLATSFFTAHGDCATATSCTTKPWFKITFASAQTVARIARRGNREYASGYDFLTGTFEVLDGADSVLWQGTYDLPLPDRDLDLVLPVPIANAVSVKFSSLSDESDEPGFSELEVFGP
jgi:hypothetical protein